MPYLQRVQAIALFVLMHIHMLFLRFVIGLLFRLRYRIKVLGLEHIPKTGGLLVLGNHISFVDWALVQLACPRRLHFVIEKNYYDRWYWRWMLDWAGVVPISSSASAESLERVTALLKKGEAVCLFPEGAITRTGQLADFKRGYERAIRDTEAQIVPF